jgi:hypothetical protein
MKTKRSSSKARRPFNFLFVAGPGIEPGSGGYEPPEVPLLYPAIYLLLPHYLLCAPEKRL